jgi:hypothetical protein
MIYLKYGIWSAGSITWSSSQSFNELKFIETPVSEHNSGRTLSGIDYKHNKSNRSEWELVISANELTDSTKLAFLKNFHFASAWKFSLVSNWATETVVTIEDGQQGIDYIENCKYLPEISIKLVQKVPNSPLTIS